MMSEGRSPFTHHSSLITHHPSLFPRFRMAKKGSVLVVDDEEIMRDVLETLLSAEGYRVDLAKTGEEGLECYGRRAYDVVLMDVSMPGMGGLRALEEILKADAEAVVIVITAYATFDTAIGASGTGKELIARAIHMQSTRAAKSFVTVNSSNIPSELLESELFGHTRGAFTGAVAAKKGLFEVADGGSLFLDEIGDIPPETQARLLRVLQEREFTPLGDTTPRKVDVRIVAATNIDLKEAVRQGSFREDLYYRLAVVPIELPPLRERREDILPLAQHFVRKYNEENARDVSDQLAPDVLALLEQYTWPGNV